MNTTRRFAIAALLLWCACTNIALRDNNSPLRVPAPGRDRVGFRAEGHVNIWYPASGGGQAMLFRDYADTLDQVDRQVESKRLSQEQKIALFETPMRAHRNAEESDGPRAVVAIALPRGAEAVDYAVIGEYLASHGYVAIAAPATAKLPSRTSWRTPVFVHDVQVDTWSFVADPQTAARHASELLAFLKKQTGS